MTNFTHIWCLLLLIVSATVAEKLLFSPKYLSTQGGMSKDCEISADDSIECDHSRRYQRLLSVPLGAFLYHVVADITIGVNPKYGNTTDSDFWIVLSDGSQAIGFFVLDRYNYKGYEPCVHAQGTPGASFTNRKVMHYGPLIETSNPYPQTYNFLISTHQQAGTCQTATAVEGAYTTAGLYSTTLTLGKPITLDIYSDDEAGEKYNFRYIAVDIHVGI
ncbi:uncharacterized protein [Dysidea avara]|uniref:uncharacterized protein n=1 Tax=Dysidea avara TaxID=196820 RepID=UPI003319010A